MTEEQRRQAAAQRCADLANVRGAEYRAADFIFEGGPWEVALNAILQLDELARMVMDLLGPLEVGFGLPDGVGTTYGTALRHRLPEPNPSPVERLARLAGLTVDQTLDMLAGAKLKLVEMDPSDDQ